MVGEYTLPTGNRPRTWRNTLCRPKIDPGRGGTQSTNPKTDPGRGGTQSADQKSTWDVVEHTLPTRNQLRLDGTHSGDRISIWEMAEHTLSTGNQLEVTEHTLPAGN